MRPAISRLDKETASYGATAHEGSNHTHNGHCREQSGHQRQHGHHDSVGSGVVGPHWQCRASCNARRQPLHGTCAVTPASMPCLTDCAVTPAWCVADCAAGNMHAQVLVSTGLCNPQWPPARWPPGTQNLKDPLSVRNACSHAAEAVGCACRHWQNFWRQKPCTASCTARCSGHHQVTTAAQAPPELERRNNYGMSPQLCCVLAAHGLQLSSNCHSVPSNALAMIHKDRARSCAFR